MKSIVIVGAKPSQINLLSNEFQGQASITGLDGDSFRRLSHGTKPSPDTTIVLLDFVSHRHTQTLAKTKNIQLIRGGLTRVREAITNLLEAPITRT